MKAPDQAGGSVDGLGTGDDRVAPCVDPNSHGGIGDGDGGKAPADSGAGAVVTAAGAVAAGSSGQDEAARNPMV